MNIENHELWSVYGSWWEKNKIVIASDQWNLVDRAILESPEEDMLRGLNILSFLDTETNSEVDAILKGRLQNIIGDNWEVPAEGRHITVLDILPHNSGKTEAEIKSNSEEYISILNKILASRKFDIRIAFSGIFASPDGITLQGFPVTNDLEVLRNLLREEFSKAGLINLEKNKYIINTAHVALVKFTQEIDGGKLIELVEELRKTPQILWNVKNIILNISSRYDKVKSIDKIKEWQL